MEQVRGLNFVEERPRGDVIQQVCLVPDHTIFLTRMPGDAVDLEVPFGESR